MSIKSFVAYSVLLVLNFYIDFLLLVAHCLVFILDYLKDVPPGNQDILVPTTVEKTCALDEGIVHENGPTVVGITPTDKTSVSPSAEVQTRPPSPPPPLPLIQVHQAKMTTVSPTSPSSTPDFPSSPAAPPSWIQPGRVSLRRSPRWTPEMLAFLGSSRAVDGSRADLFPFLGEIGILRNASDSSQGGSSDQLRSIIPCWDRDDVTGSAGGSTCPIIPNPKLNVYFNTLLSILSRAVDLSHKFESDGNISWLKRASHIFDHTLAVSHSSDELFASVLMMQAAVRGKLFDVTEDVSLLDHSIDGFQAGLARVPHNAIGRHDFLRQMGDLLEKRHDKRERREDLDRAIEAYTEALRLWPQDEGPPVAAINGLGLALHQRFRVGGDLSDLESAIHRLDGLLSIVDGDHPLRSRILCNLGVAFLARSQRRGSVADVERAISLLEDSRSLQSQDQGRAGILHNLALAFRIRFGMSGSVSNLDDAICLYQKSLFLRHDDHLTLNNLASALSDRYKRTGDATDLGQAIIHLKTAISCINDDDPRRTAYLGNLAGMLDGQYDVSKDATDLTKAIEIHEEVLSLHPSTHPNRPLILNNLFGALIRRFLLSDDVSDRDRGLDCVTESLSLLPSDHPYRQTILFHLLHMRSSFSPWGSLSIGDLTLVLDQCVELVELTPQQHPGYSKTVTLVVRVLLTCHMKRLDIRQLLLALGLDSELSAEDAALALLERASGASTSPSAERLEAISHWVHLCQALNRPCTLEVFTRMLNLLDLSIARGCSLETRHKQLSTDPSILPAKRLVPEAVAFAIEQGAIETAIEFLERGQSTLLTQLSRYRSSSLLDSLHSIRPDLATRFRDLSWQVEHATFTEGKPLPGLDVNRPLEDPISRSNRLKTDWDDVVQQIRALDGFSHFLRPVPFTILREAAAEGPVILVNISKSRSDAIIVTADQPPLVVPLEFATPNKIESLVSWSKATPQSMSNSNAVNGLKAVWDTIVEPVTTELQDTTKLPNNSRIWWCPTNSAVSLPLHAAGLYRLKDDHLSLTRNCLPFLYISSYTPSLEALVRARQDRHHHSGLPSVFLVGQPNTPGQVEIPQVREEIRLIKKRIPHSLVLTDDRGTHSKVLTGVIQHQWVHLACHGHVKSSDPLHSHFSLHDGPLPLLEIMQQRLPTAEFAFLSACHSASGNSDTSDEFLHLAAGMQFAGFKSVVGTMWAMADEAGPPLADEFYRRMLPKGGTVDHTRAAKALQAATRKLLKDGFPLAVWINFVHWGA